MDVFETGMPKDQPVASPERCSLIEDMAIEGATSVSAGSGSALSERESRIREGIAESFSVYF